MKKTLLFYGLGLLTFVLACYDLFVGGDNGLLEAVALFVMALIFTLLGSTFYLGHHLQKATRSEIDLSSAKSRIKVNA